MRITEVRIKLMENSEDRLRGFCSVTFDDCFVVRDLKIIEGNNGPFVAMPSRKLTSNCPKCRTKNHLRARYCNQCGHKLRIDSIPHDSDGRARLYADIAHPVNAECREMIQSRVIEEFSKEIDLAKQPGYVSRYDDDYGPDWRVDKKVNREPQPQPQTTKSDEPKSRRVDAPAGKPQSHDKKQSETQSIKPSGNEDQPGSDSGFGQGVFD
ncbi:MAG: SpoVG family protein [Planctomycetota bacterium]